MAHKPISEKLYRTLKRAAKANGLRTDFDAPTWRGQEVCEHATGSNDEIREHICNACRYIGLVFVEEGSIVFTKRSGEWEAIAKDGQGD